MSEAPERIWACMDGPMVGLFVSGGYDAGWPEYVRADLFDAVKDGCDALEARVKALTESLTYISDLVSAIQIKAKADGYQVDGLTALQISLDPDHLQSTARAALQENTDDR